MSFVTWKYVHRCGEFVAIHSFLFTRKLHCGNTIGRVDFRHFYRNNNSSEVRESNLLITDHIFSLSWLHYMSET